MSHKLVSLYIGDGEYYTRTDADALLANLKEKHKTEVKELLCLIRDKENNFNRAFDSEEKELRHQKYKRCLAMSKLCNEKWLVHNFAEITTKLGFYDKWEKRWLELAEKFKEAK